MDELRALKYFVKIVELGNFNKAAAFFSVPSSSLSRRVASLEESLGATLLKRTTRVVQPTEVGREYYQQVSEVLGQLEKSNELVKSYQTKPSGKLSISAMVGVGERILFPLLDELGELYPDLVMEVHLSDELAAFSYDEVDIAIRGGHAPNERVVALPLIDNTFYPVASPDYLARMGTPKTPLDLPQHKGLYYRMPTGPNPWLCQIDGQWRDVSAPAVVISNGDEWLLRKAVEGEGIVMMPRWILKPYIERGELVEIDINPAVSITQKPGLAIYLLYQKQRYHVPKIKVAVDFLVERIKGHY
ncbi:LysR family transcriptional regulator [Thalassomonas sp. RHCl1]|uniref:LysR family transcriptional regulator n=1 Tax=Thalassomonas sp. RHCl1 TaxID=2995320 RepID=UPI00248AAD48|nr:LysR family transcriptional regulator [Thalassomonas sp. RHCl1]